MEPDQTLTVDIDRSQAAAGTAFAHLMAYRMVENTSQAIDCILIETVQGCSRTDRGAAGGDTVDARVGRGGLSGYRGALASELTNSGFAYLLRGCLIGFCRG